MVLAYALGKTKFVVVVIIIITTTIIIIIIFKYAGQDSSVGIATCYRLDGLGIKSQWGRDFLYPFRPVRPASSTLGTGSFLVVKCLGCGDDQPPQPSAEVKERVELYLYSPSGPLWPVLGENITLSLLFLNMKELKCVTHVLIYDECFLAMEVHDKPSWFYSIIIPTTAHI